MNREQPLVSVIVPVYNVEAYLPECVDSIRKQTYENLEILLVDDGSPDRCGAICDRAAAEDGRVRVIHQENGGVSAARNAGLDAASGAYLAFVDGDDLLPPDGVEGLYAALRENGTDLAGGQFVHLRGDIRVPVPYPIKQCVLTRRDAFAAMLENRLPHSVCGKLYRADLFQGIRFTPGTRTSEDMEASYRVLARAETMAVTEAVSYIYRMREGSAIHTRFEPWWYEQETETAERTMDFVEGLYPDLADLCAGRLCYQYLGVLERLMNSGGSGQYGAYRRELREKLRKAAPPALKSRRVRRTLRARLFLYRYGGERLYMAVRRRMR